MIEVMLNRLRLSRLRRAIKTCESAGLAVVQVKRSEGAIYLVGRNGQYVRYNKEK